MALNKLNIPKTIKVGFQEREDTYTNKLAYVIYIDAKGVLRKERSWEGWRDKKIEPEEYSNEPTSGFVLNKKVGGYRTGWDARATYVRVYDPRGFEFEISVPNLLFILEECSSIKGKGLEGEFVYAWDGTELVLLPVTSQEYEDSTQFTALQTKKITKADVKEGCVYVNKDGERVMYLGRHPWSEYTYSYSNGLSYNENSTTYSVKTKMKHVFVYMSERQDSYQSPYWLQDGFTKLASIESPECCATYPDQYDKLMKECSHIGDEFTVDRVETSVLEGLVRRDYYGVNFVAPDHKYMGLHKHYDKIFLVEYGETYYSPGANSVTIETTRRPYYFHNSGKKVITEEEAAGLIGVHYRLVNKKNGCVLYTT